MDIPGIMNDIFKLAKRKSRNLVQSPKFSYFPGRKLSFIEIWSRYYSISYLPTVAASALIFVN